MDYVRIRGQRGLCSKTVAVVVAGIAFVTLGGTASAASAAGKQYEKIVAPFNKLANEQNAPAVPTLRSTIAGTEKKLRAAHWPPKVSKDVRLLATDLKSVESLFVDEAKAKSTKYKPTQKQAAAAVVFLGQITKVHKDLGLPPSNEQGM